MGTIRDLAGATLAGTSVWLRNHLSYSAFGQVREPSALAVDQLFGFYGESFDPVSKLNLIDGAAYDPRLRRFINEKTSENPVDTQNRYVFQRNTPVNRKLPTSADREYDADGRLPE